MNGLDRQRMISALLFLVMAAFVAGNVPQLRHRRFFRQASIVLYAFVFGLALVWIVLWLAGLDA